MDENMFDLGLDVATISVDLPDPVITLSGADSYTVQDTADYPLLALSVYGKSVQDGTPTPEAPIDIVSVGDDGTVEVMAWGKNLYDISTATRQLVSGDGFVVNDPVYLLSDYISCSDYDKITVSGVVGTGAVWYRIAKYDNDKNFIVRVAEKNVQTGAYTFDVSDCTYIRLCYEDEPVSDTVVTNVQVEYGATATAYEPYKDNTATITSGLPLCSVGDVRDELVYNADGTGKIIKRTAKKRIAADGVLTAETNWKTGCWQMANFFTNGLKIAGYNTIVNNLCDYAEFKYSPQELVYTEGITGVAQGNGTNLYFRFSTEHTTTEAVTNYLNTNEVYIVYQLATPQEIELSADEMAELQKLQSYEGTTSIYNDEQAEMLVKMLRREFDMKYIEWLKESQTWTCPKAGKWKVICVGGGASGGMYEEATSSGATEKTLTPTTAGGTTSFGSIIAADGAPSTSDYTAHGYSTGKIAVSGYGGYTGTSYGGVPMVGSNASSAEFGAGGGSGNAAVMAFANPTAAVGYGAGGGAGQRYKANFDISPIPGRAGKIESTIVDLDEGQTIMCTVGKGGQTTDPATMGSGADGVIVVQYLGY